MISFFLVYRSRGRESLIEVRLSTSRLTGHPLCPGTSKRLLRVYLFRKRSRGKFLTPPPCGLATSVPDSGKSAAQSAKGGGRFAAPSVTAPGKLRPRTRPDIVKSPPVLRAKVYAYHMKS